MPVDLEMFLSQTGASLFDCSPFVENRFSFVNSFDEDGFVRSYSFPRSHILIPKDSKRLLYTEKKKTVDSYHFDTFPKCYKKSVADGNKRKKVTFADDKGYNLVEIREIPGLPNWSNSSLASVISNAQHETVIQKGWKVAFESPPWTDSKLMDLLETNKVALESVVVKVKAEDKSEQSSRDKWSGNYHTALPEAAANNDFVLQGTIKVKNLSFEKNVFVRISFDRWLSSVDVKAKCLNPAKQPVKRLEYDTFSFSIDIPSIALKYEVIEFCIGYFCNSEKYWDNNGCVNYRLVTEVVKNNTVSTNRRSNKKSNDRITLSLTDHIEIFSEMDSWSNFMKNQPYW